MEDSYDFVVYTSDLNDRFGRVKDDSYLFDMGNDQFDENKPYSMMQDELYESNLDSVKDDSVYYDADTFTANNDLYEEFTEPLQEKKR